MAIIVGLSGNNPLLQGTELDDLIYGNSLGTVTGVAGNDRIFGRGGDDFITGDGIAIAPNGRGGDDFIQGGDGGDTIYGDAFDPDSLGDGSLYGIGGNDTLYQNGGAGTLVGDAYRLEFGSRGGNDKLFGEGMLIGDSNREMNSAIGGNDVLSARSAGSSSELMGDTFFDLLGNSVGGNDLLEGSSFGDFLWGDADDQLLDGSKGGNDRLNGYGGDDKIVGDGEAIDNVAKAGNDVLRGGGGDDTIFGDAESLLGFAVGGNDKIFGNAGNDDLWGDGEIDATEVNVTGGKDRFFFSGNFGDDKIFDFRPEDGDQIVLQGLTQLDVQVSIVTVTDPNDSTLITTLGDDSITLVGFTGSLTPGVDILFA